MLGLLYIIVILNTTTMAKEPKGAFQFKTISIHGKNFQNPQYNLFGCEKYMLPKLGNAPVHHTFFEPQQIEEVYKEMNVDPASLNHNLNLKQDNKLKEPAQTTSKEKEETGQRPDQHQMIEKKAVDKLNNGRARPELRKEGFTHFIHIPLSEQLRDIYENKIVPLIEEEDTDILMPLQTMHMTVMVFRLKQMEDIQKWSQVIKFSKSIKVNIQGVDFFQVKKGTKYGRVLYMKIKGIDDLIDTIVQRAIEMDLIKEQELSNIKFDKIQQKYVATPHISLLRTKGKDLFDFTTYLKKLNNAVNLKKVSINEIRVSMIGSHDGVDYYNEAIHKI